MDTIKPGDIVAINHYSGINPYKSVVLDVQPEFMKVKLAKEFAVMSFIVGDPAVVGIQKSDGIALKGCNVLGLKTKEDTIELKIDKLETGAENRQWERYPVSIYTDIRTRECKKKQIGIIKDMSYYGMMIYSKADLPVNEQLEVDVYMDKHIVFLKTNIARKIQSEHYFQYGLSIVYEDSSSLNYMKDYIKRITQEQEEQIRKVKIK
ncbi:MAG: PilZ domain-containing protein [Clostridia bacterium]|nr:PilZ domain-containing protein [Clostridia bacterium]